MYFYRRTFFILENMGIMKIIARYEWRLLGRSQIFWFVGCISFISVILLHFFFRVISCLKVLGLWSVCLVLYLFYALIF